MHGVPTLHLPLWQCHWHSLPSDEAIGFMTPNAHLLFVGVVGAINGVGANLFAPTS